MARFSGKNILVTGASSGIGEAVAIRLAQEGGNVAINYNSGADRAENVRKKAEEAGVSGGNKSGRHLTVKANLADEQQITGMFQQVLKEFGTLDVLINNSGIQKPVPSHELTSADFDQILNVNLRGAFLCSREAIKHWLSRSAKGVIVNNSSVHEIIPKPKYLPYSISKGGMENMTKSLALEYADRNIRINAVGPGAIVTPINNAWINNPKARAEVESHIPMGRAGEVEEISSVFAFLASDEASYVTGQTLFACGGLTLYPEFRVAWSSGE
ncbi:MAG: glucose 1-dehydrogenase [Acidobacteriaceae bacterium]|nr:glucose 1-dehydrogenase [Acidobacteriaceae bacterium]